ncbi:hypothetical protein HPB48_019328 [Haemaphysalis longicornis]|uniref:CCHC-type domain-containing protein n=1 Tax=Haemaphysalis longicornis TaxID=44386 RepID=A0A9J6GE53_HAELO|nr:hypothetical protein HPB48_019328 [Haemaphysalis longicornis]
MSSGSRRPREASPILSPGRRAFLENEARTSRRLQGRTPEFGLLPDGPRTTASSRMTSQAQQTDAPFFPLVHWPIIPRKPAPFHGDAFEDVDDWIDQYERVARHNGWTSDHCRQSFYFSLENTARIWYENNERSLTSWEVCKERLRRAFGNQYRQQKAEELLQRRIQGPNESLISFVEDVLRLSTRADPQATEEKKLRALMRGVRSDIFGGLVRNPPTTVEGFVTEATNIEKALTARNDHYHRMTDAPTISAFASAHFSNHASEGYIRELIRDVVREELQKLLPASKSPASISLVQAVQEEVQRALVPGGPVDVTPQRSAATYAAVTSQPHLLTAGPDMSTPRRERFAQTGYQQPRQQQRGPRKTDLWRTADNRPLCFHCGEADHVYRRCPYRELGLRGYRPNDPRPKYGQQPREIEDYLRRSSPPREVYLRRSSPPRDEYFRRSSPPREDYFRRPPSPLPSTVRGARSPSPHRPASPLRRSRRESQSPVPHREN